MKPNSEVMREWKYTKRNVASIEDYCLHYKKQSKRMTYYTVGLGLILSIFNVIENEHLVWLVLVSIIGLNFHYFRRIKALNRSQLAGVVKSVRGTVTSKSFKGDMLVVDKNSNHIPLLGQLLPKQFGKKLIVQPHYFVEVVEDTFMVDSVTYDSVDVGQTVDLLYTPKYHLFLDIIPVSDAELVADEQ